MIQRYHWVHLFGGLSECDEGLYVRYEDHKAIVDELLEALEEYKRYLALEVTMSAPRKGHICGPESNCDTDCQVYFALATNLNKIRAAIAKAKGEK